MTTNDETDIRVKIREGSVRLVAQVSLDKCVKRRDPAKRRRCSKDGNRGDFLTPCSRKYFIGPSNRLLISPSSASSNRPHALGACIAMDAQRIGAGYEPQGAGRAARCSTSTGRRRFVHSRNDRGQRPGEWKIREILKRKKNRVGDSIIPLTCTFSDRCHAQL